MIKLIASDLDGTIIDRSNSICKNNLNAIEVINEKQIPFAICSGKTYPIIKNMCTKFNATYGIFGNGSQIVNLKTGEEIYKRLLTMEDLETCYNIAKKHNMHVHVYTNNDIITEELMYMDLRNFKLKETKYYESSLEFKVVNNVFDFVKENNCEILKLVISHTDNLSPVEKEIKASTDLSVRKISKHGDYRDNVINKDYEYLDITPKDIDKKQAIEFLRSYLNVENDEVMAIGDNLNDLEMVKSFGVGVAVANAYDEIKQVAKYTTINNVENGGFAEAVFKYIEF